MHLIMNTTSPFVRLVRIAIAEKGITHRVEMEIVNPWANSEAFLKANPAGRIPTLLTDDGTAIAEASLILRYLDDVAPEPSIFPSHDLANTLSIAATAIGAMEAATAVIIGRKSSEKFDADMVGSKRFRTMTDSLARLDENLPRDFNDRPDIANFAAVTALDYIALRYPDRDWLGHLPNLKSWRARQEGRPSVDETMPHT